VKRKSNFGYKSEKYFEKKDIERKKVDSQIVSLFDRLKKVFEFRVHLIDIEKCSYEMNLSIILKNRKYKKFVQVSELSKSPQKIDLN
jgi:hypothetical protein